MYPVITSYISLMAERKTIMKSRIFLTAEKQKYHEKSISPIRDKQKRIKGDFFHKTKA